MIPEMIPDLRFDARDILATLEPWVLCESPTHDAAAVNRMMGVAARDLALLGATVETIPGRMGLSDCVRARFPHRDRDAPGILVLGHLDTVHPVGTLGSLPWRIEGDRAYGPGILDMKGGNVVALAAIRALAAPEPGQPENGVVTGRYAIARFELEALGRPSHAGASPHEGRSAIRAMARKILAIDALSDADCTVSTGVVSGGQWVNCVPTVCRGQALSMAKRQADLDRGVARMLALSGEEDGVRFTVTRGVTRPVWEPDAGCMALYERARALSEALGQPLPHRSAGGGSDGNFTGANGIPTLDGLGPLGQGYHTLEEHVLIESLPRRARLFAALLASLGAAGRA
jgi:glutamate carboxypeptidase